MLLSTHQAVAIATLLNVSTDTRFVSVVLSGKTPGSRIDVKRSTVRGSVHIFAVQWGATMAREDYPDVDTFVLAYKGV